MLNTHLQFCFGFPKGNKLMTCLEHVLKITVHNEICLHSLKDIGKVYGIAVGQKLIISSTYLCDCVVIIVIIHRELGIHDSFVYI